MARNPFTTVGPVAAALVIAACAGPKGAPSVKPASAFRAEVHATAAAVNDYLAAHDPGNTAREEIRQTLGDRAHDFTVIAAQARPLQGKTGDKEYGRVAARAEDGVIVAGNLAGAVAADPAKMKDARANLARAVGDWAAFNETLAGEAGGGAPFTPRRWWEAPAWREAASAETAGEAGGPP